MQALTISSAAVLDTAANPHSICELAPGRVLRLAVPASHSGCLQVINLDGPEGDEVIVVAHANPVRCCVFSFDGALLATASTKGAGAGCAPQKLHYCSRWPRCSCPKHAGTCIRVFHVASGECMRELRRGSDPATVMCMSFSAGAQRLALASTKPAGVTVHLFALTDDDEHVRQRPQTARRHCAACLIQCLLGRRRTAIRGFTACGSSCPASLAPSGALRGAHRRPHGFAPVPSHAAIPLQHQVPGCRTVPLLVWTRQQHDCACWI